MNEFDMRNMALASVINAINNTMINAVQVWSDDDDFHHYVSTIYGGFMALFYMDIISDEIFEKYNCLLAHNYYTDNVTMQLLDDLQTILIGLKRY